MRTFLVALVAGAAVAGGYLLAPNSATTAATPAVPTAPATPAAPVPPAVVAARLIAHEWGTFTSFSGSNGLPLAFHPNNTDLPGFVYYSSDQNSKSGRLSRGGLISMETPVVYFYTDRETKVSVKVDFPKGWITEWYPFASTTPVQTPLNDTVGGQSIKWDVKLTPGEPERFPRVKADRGGRQNHYYHARETDAVPLQTEVTPVRQNEDDEGYYDERGLRGGTVVQREKFLFYRGVGTFPPPVTVKALGGGRVKVVNTSGGRAKGLTLVTVSEGKLSFRALPDIEPGASADAALATVGSSRTELADHLVKELTREGLYEKEAKAMVKTWDSAWFGEEGTRLLYLVPRAKTDELLPLTMNPRPTELVRVLVGRHDFLTPEAEVVADAEVKRLRAAEKEMNAAYEALRKLGRFSSEAQQQAKMRLEKGTEK